MAQWGTERWGSFEWSLDEALRPVTPEERTLVLAWFSRTCVVEVSNCVFVADEG